jgi:hypothetical protein
MSELVLASHVMGVKLRIEIDVVGVLRAVIVLAEELGI